MHFWTLKGVFSWPTRSPDNFGSRTEDDCYSVTGMVNTRWNIMCPFSSLPSLSGFALRRIAFVPVSEPSFGANFSRERTMPRHRGLSHHPHPLRSVNSSMCNHVCCAQLSSVSTRSDGQRYECSPTASPFGTSRGPLCELSGLRLREVSTQVRDLA